MSVVGEVKKGAMKLADDLEGVTSINRQIKNDYSRLLAEIDLFLKDTSSEELKSVYVGIEESMKRLDQEKERMMDCIIDIQSLANKL